MKNYTFILFLMIPLLTWSQGPSLTKEETVNYLDKKLKETQNHYRTVSPQSGNNIRYYYWGNNYVSLNNNNVEIKFHRSNYATEPVKIREVYYNRVYQKMPCDYYIERTTFTFNPAHIVNIQVQQNVDESDPVGILMISLVGKTANWSNGRTTNESLAGPGWKFCYDVHFPDWANRKISTGYLEIPYLRSDPTNLNKVVKALEYLRDLYKVEDDPFGS